MTYPTIGVVTVSRGRPGALRRAMASVRAQDYPGAIVHVVVADEDPETVATAAAEPVGPGRTVEPHLVPRPPAERNEPPGDKARVYPRLSRLFNYGARVAPADRIAYLDDDNEFEPDHLSSLVECAESTGAGAVHSGRSLWHADGEPDLREVWHTVAEPAEAGRIYDLMCARGVRVRGTNLLLDRADTAPARTLVPSSVISDDDPVLLVDQSVWLIPRETLLAHPIPETFTTAELAMNAAPDDKLLQTLLEAGVRIVTTGRPTVRYYLGGVSTSHPAA